MSLARFLGTLGSALLLSNCSGAIPTIGEQSDVHQLYTHDALPVAFEKALSAVTRAGGTVVRADAQAGTNSRHGLSRPRDGLSADWSGQRPDAGGSHRPHPTRHLFAWQARPGQPHHGPV